MKTPEVKNRSLRLETTLIALCLMVLASQAQDEYLRLTILAIHQTGINGNTAQLQCYSTKPGSDTTFEFGRTAPIPSDQAADTPAGEEHHASKNRNPWLVRFSGSSWNTDGFGAFYCNGSSDGFRSTLISAFFMRSDAKFTPTDGVFTRTVSVDDPEVVINMTQVHNPDQASSTINWRKDGGDVFNTGSHQYTISHPVQTTDGGIYEIHFSNERSSGKGALYRLIVRDCPSGKWGPPDCHGICDKCYNGGVCDHRTGTCICPNNFKGTNCLEICRTDGGNRFGSTCEYKCSYNDDATDKCRGNMFCLPDPFGCTCDVGFKGLNCTAACPNGVFGAGCTQTCHCQSGCNPYTGCNGGCDTGWSGVNCQIPDTCDKGYYGSECTDKCHCLNDAPCAKTTGECPNQECAAGYEVYDGPVNCQECQGAFYGMGCAQKCRCQESACDKVTGLCNGECFPNWALPECTKGISDVTTNAAVNPYQPSDFTCVVQAVSGFTVPDVSDVYFYRYVNEDDSMNNTGITKIESSLHDNKLSVDFLVDSVVPGTYVCHLLDPPIATLFVNASTFVLPVMRNAPDTSNITSNVVDVYWTAWNADENDKGDPPLVGYTIYQSMLPTGQTEEESVGPEVTSVTLSGLEPDTDYQFSVAAVREGAGGTGSRSPSTNSTTLCGSPSGAPSDIFAIPERPKELTLTWTSPTAGSAQCRSGFTQHHIYYAPTGDVTFQKITIDDVSDTAYTLSDLATYTEYTLYMTYSNKDAEGDKSVSSKTMTMEEIAPPPVDVSVIGRTGDSLTIKWSAASPHNLNGVIVRYDIQYNTTNGMGVDSTEQLKITLRELESESNYTITVRTVNGAGEGEWSTPLYTSTQAANATGNLAAIIGGAAGGVSAITIILLLAFIFFRKNQGKDDPGHYTQDGETHPIDNIDGDYETDLDTSRIKPPVPNKPVAVVSPVLSEAEIYEVVSHSGPIPVTELESYYGQTGQEGKAAQEYGKIKREKLYPWEVGKKEINRAKNRFKNILAYDHSRVVLEKINDDPDSDYYNASYIKDYKGNRYFIASQAPNKASIGDFFRLIWQEGISTVVMATHLVEGGKDKCKRYWPSSVNTAARLGDFTLTMTEETHFSDHVVRTIIVKKNTSSSDYENLNDSTFTRTITQFHYVSWRDMAVPEHGYTLTDFIETIKEHHNKNLQEGSTGPMLVHCSAGVGRTGSLISLYTMMDMMRETGTVDVFGFVTQMRQNRFMMVQTREQYVFIYDTLFEVYLSGNTAFPASDFTEKHGQLRSVNPGARKSALQLEFENLQRLTPLPPSTSFRGGRDEKNIAKNRFPDILPLDKCRPYLTIRGDGTSTDYINASFIGTFHKKDTFLVTQSPLPNTVVDIWRMVLDWNCPVIVMLNQLDQDDQTCAKYWPKDDVLQVGDATVTKAGEETFQTYTKSSFAVAHQGQTTTVQQFQFDGWKTSQGRPDSPLDLITLIEAVETSSNESAAKGPIVVHCMNGISRSGVFCALWSAVEKIRGSGKVDIFQAVRRLRAGRPNMVDSLDLYCLCYDVIRDHLQRFDQYANLPSK